jgi:glycosyltransferase involved in cell wall biosynthesis
VPCPPGPRSLHAQAAGLAVGGGQADTTWTKAPARPCLDWRAVALAEPGSSSDTQLAHRSTARRVVIVSPNPPGFVGGVERSCALLASVLEAHGAVADIVWPRSEPPLWAYRAGLRPLALSRRMGARPELAGADLIVSNGAFGWGFPRATPRIHVFHGTLAEMTRAYAPGLARRERLRRRWGGGTAEALAARHSTIVCVSESTAEEITRHYGLRSDAIVPNGVDLDTFRPRSRAAARAELGLPAQDRLALFAGRLNASKGGEFMQRACERAGYQFLVAGSAAPPPAVNLGVMGPEALAVAYAAADCVLLPSLYEASSYVVLEALACGTPLLATRVGSIPSLLRDVPGYDALCIRANELDLASRLDYLRNTDTTTLSRQARTWVAENNGLGRYAERWDALVDSIL